MTRKDYIAIAKTIKARVDYLAQQSDEYVALECMVADLCTTFQTDNSQFNRSRFTEACGFGI